MNRMTISNQKAMILLAVLMALTVMLVGCRQEAPQQPQAAETMVVTEAPETTAPEETTLPEETEVIVTIPEVEAPEASSITYGEYLELTVEEQQAYYENFETPDAFFVWLNSAMAEYSASTEPVETFGDENQEATGDDFFEEESVEDW